MDTMEEILGVEMREPISLQQFLNDWKTSIKSTILPKCEDNIKDAMNLTHDVVRFNNVKTACSLEQLSQENDPNIMKFQPGITNPTRIPLVLDESNLKSYNELIRGKSSIQQRNPFKRTRESFALAHIRSQSEIGNFNSFNFYNDIIVKVRVYRPARAVHTGQSLEKPVFAEEFDCLGSNYLSELRDKISCVCKKKRFFDISSNPTAELPNKTTDPGYFFINNTFYNDRRNPGNADYSEFIRNWAKQAIGLKDLRFNVAQMESTRFLDLTVSIGFPQLYQHHGNCEHVFIISQVELLVPGNVKDQYQEYPRLCSCCYFNNRVCNMCGTRGFTYIVTKSDRQLHDPAYICNQCFINYHYIDGKKIGQFEAYRLNECDEKKEVAQNNGELTREDKLDDAYEDGGGGMKAASEDEADADLIE